MPVVVKLTGLKHSDWADACESVTIGNQVSVRHDPEFDNDQGRAYKVIYGAWCIGYIPLLESIEDYGKGAASDAERDRLRQWWVATKKVRLWLDSRVKYNSDEQWTALVHTILYKDKNGNYNTKEIGEAEQVSIVFEDAG